VAVSSARERRENSPEEAELATLVDVIEAYEAQRWPLGKNESSKGCVPDFALATRWPRTAQDSPGLASSVAPQDVCAPGCSYDTGEGFRRCRKTFPACFE
jgi:hypothetical protein